MCKNLICSVLPNFIIIISLMGWLYLKMLGTDMNVCETDALGRFVIEEH